MKVYGLVSTANPSMAASKAGTAINGTLRSAWFTLLIVGFQVRGTLMMSFVRFWLASYLSFMVVLADFRPSDVAVTVIVPRSPRLAFTMIIASPLNALRS